MLEELDYWEAYKSYITIVVIGFVLSLGSLYIYKQHKYIEFLEQQIMSYKGIMKHAQTNNK